MRFVNEWDAAESGTEESSGGADMFGNQRCALEEMTVFRLGGTSLPFGKRRIWQAFAPDGLISDDLLHSNNQVETVRRIHMYIHKDRYT